MKKKLLTVAMVATMAISSVLSAVAAETLTGTAWWTGMQVSADTEIKGNGTLEYTIKCTDVVEDAAAFSVEITDASKNYFTTGSDVNAWWAETALNDGNKIEGVVEPFVSDIVKDATYKITVDRNDKVFTVTYYDVTNSKELGKLTGTAVNAFDETVVVHVMAQLGTYEVDVKAVGGTETPTTETPTTKAPAKATTTKEADKDNGIDPVVIVVIVVVAVVVVAGIVVATKKKK